MARENAETPKGPRQIFDRARVRRNRRRSAGRLPDAHYLLRRVGADLVDRIETASRDFDRALIVGAGPERLALTEAAGVGQAFYGDVAETRLPNGVGRIVFDLEASPFGQGGFDLIVDALNLHTANDLVGALIQYRRALKPDGLLLAALFAEDTLSRFKAALYAAETETTGRLASRVAPFAPVQSLGQALARAGFALPVADIDRATVRFAEPYSLLSDLKAMGETYPLAGRPEPLPRAALAGALGRFAAAGGEEIFDIAYLTGWAPAPSQPKPLKPGSAEASMAAAVRGARRPRKD